MSTRSAARENVLGLTVLLSVVSLGLVFGTALGAVPDRFLPVFDGVVTLVPHVNVVLSVAALAAIATGVRAIRRGEVRRHRRWMLTAFTLFLGFLVLYLYKVAAAGTASFPGPDVVYTWVYLPLLAVHVLLAVVTLPLLYYVLLLAATHEVRELPSTPHPRVGRVVAGLWSTSFVLGIVVYLLLYVVY